MRRYGNTRSYTPRPRKPILLRQEIFTGMRDNYDPSSGTKNKATLLQNVYPQDAEVGGGLVGRPGFQAMSTALGATSRGQRTYQFTKLDGTEVTVLFSGGAMLEIDWGARSVSVVGAMVGLDTEAHIACVTFNDGVVISDGVHKPWHATRSGGGVWSVTQMANCPVLFGQPVVHYACLVGIKAAERNVIVWSEVNDPFTGYEAGGFNNAWQLGQTDQEPLYALGATNAALYYWRGYSIGAIYGAVTAEWSTSGVQDSVSTSTGTLSPWGVVQYEESFYFPDAEAMVQRLLIGGGLQQPAPGLDARETTRSIPRGDLGSVVGANWAQGGLVLFAFSRISGEPPELVLTFQATTGIFTGIWTIRAGHLRTLDVVKDASGKPTLFHQTDTGRAYDWGHPQGTVWSDHDQPIEHIVFGTPLGWDQAAVKRFERVHISLRLSSALTDMRFNYATPRARTEELSVSGTGTFPLWDQVDWDEFQWAGETQEQKLTIGIEDEARWIQLRLRHSGLGEQFGLLGWSVEAYQMGLLNRTL